MSDSHNKPDVGNVNPEALRLGHEPDEFSLGPVMSVPVVVVLFFAASFGVVSLLFYFVNPMKRLFAPPAVYPLAEKLSEEPINERLARINLDKGTVRQPRLEGLRRIETEEGDQPPFSRTFTPLPPGPDTGNSPEFHPEDLLPTSDYARRLQLESFTWSDKAKEIARIPVTQAMKLVVSEKMLKVQDKPVDVSPTRSWTRPKMSNAGRGNPLPEGD
jgi:hypothetical protein